jgi:hypothetical protein
MVRDKKSACHKLRQFSPENKKRFFMDCQQRVKGANPAK